MNSVLAERLAESKLLFSGHETFPFRYNWLVKGYELVKRDPESLSHAEQAMIRLGLGKNMVRSLRHWLIAAGLCETSEHSNRALITKPLADLLFDKISGKDRFIEDPGTLWLIHWNLCSDPQRSTTWYLSFALLTDTEFRKAHLVDLVAEAVEQASAREISRRTLERDVDCFLRTYVEHGATARGSVVEDSLVCPLAELGLITPASDGGRDEVYLFGRGPQHSLDDRLFAYAVDDYWSASHKGASSLSFERLAYAPGSPGLVFRLDEITLARRLDNLERVTTGALHFTESAGVRQLVRTRRTEPIDFVRAYYSQFD